MNPTGRTTFKKNIYILYVYNIELILPGTKVFAEVDSMSQQCCVPGGKRCAFRSWINVVLGSGDVAT